MVPECYPRCPDIHDLSEFYRLYDLGRHVLTLRPLLTAKNLLPPTNLTVLTLTPKNICDNHLGPPQMLHLVTLCPVWRGTQSIFSKAKKYVAGVIDMSPIQIILLRTTLGV